MDPNRLSPHKTSVSAPDCNQDGCVVLSIADELLEHMLLILQLSRV